MFDHIDELFGICKRHLGSGEATRDHIEPMMVGYMLTVIYSGFEVGVRDAILERFKAIDDLPLKNFLRYASGRITRSIYIGELSGILAHFDESMKVRFKEAVDSRSSVPGKIPSSIGYDNIVTNRHNIAHEGQVNATILEVEGWFSAGRYVIVEFRRALGLT